MRGAMRDAAHKAQVIRIETDRIEAYRTFRGRDPDVKYIMKKRGFPTGE